MRYRDECSEGVEGAPRRTQWVSSVLDVQTRDAGGSAGPAGARHGDDLRKCLFSPFWPRDLILIDIQAADGRKDLRE